MKKILLAALLASSVNFCHALKVNVGALGGFTVAKVKDKTSVTGLSLAKGHGIHGMDEKDESKETPGKPKLFNDEDFGSGVKNEKMTTKCKFDGSGFIDASLLEHSMGNGKMSMGLFTSFGSLRIHGTDKNTHHDTEFKTNGFEFFVGPNLTYVSPCGKLSFGLIAGPSVFKSKYSAQLDAEAVLKSVEKREDIHEHHRNALNEIKNSRLELDEKTSVAFALGFMASYKVHERINIVLLLKSIPSKTIEYKKHENATHAVHSFKDRKIGISSFQASLGISYRLV
jgi:hypothetical protein